VNDAISAERRVLLVGGSGFIGSRLTKALVERGATVAVMSRTRGRLEGLLSPQKYEFLPCDITDVAPTRRAMLAFAPDTLYFLAAQPDAEENLAQAERCIRVNLTGLLNVLDSFREARGRLAVIGDSSKVYGNRAVPYADDTPPDPRSSYAISKVAGWEYAKLYARLHGMSVVSVRPTLIYGPGQGHNLISALARAAGSAVEDVRLAGGAQTRAPLYIDDAVDALMRIATVAADLSGQVINLGGPEERSVADIARLTLDVLNCRLPIRPDPTQIRATETVRSACDNLSAKRLLGWEPRTALLEGLQRTLRIEPGS
jgi:UDP-glucose 4-epimerase